MTPPRRSAPAPTRPRRKAGRAPAGALAAGLLALSLAAALPGGRAEAAGFPRAIDYVLQLRSSAQHQDNPARLPDSSAERRGSAVLVNSVGAAVRVPLLSDDTRLDIAGNVADVRYSRNEQLDHRPADMRATLNWRLTDRVAGRVDYGYDKQLNDYQARTWPERDMVARRRLQAEAGLRLTERLTAPVVAVFDNRTRYRRDENRTLYDRDESGWQVSARYAGGADRAYAETGVRETRAQYPRRDAALVPLIDDGYRDREIFVGAQRGLSPKTLLQARVGYLQRDYDHLSGRDTGLLTFDARGIWDYSPKTRFDLQLWRRPYAYDDDPDVIYATQTGGSVGVRWQATEKLALGMSVERTRQKNTMASGGSGGDLRILRYGTRLEWRAYDSLRWVLDYYRDRQRGENPGDSYRQDFVRLGVEYTYGSNAGEETRGALTEMLRPGECEWRRPPFSLC